MRNPFVHKGLRNSFPFGYCRQEGAWDYSWDCFALEMLFFWHIFPPAQVDQRYNCHRESCGGGASVSKAHAVRSPFVKHFAGWGRVRRDSNGR